MLEVELELTPDDVAEVALEGADRYAVCLRYTPRNASSKDSLVLFRDGRLDRIIDAARETCKDAAYQPFPELQRLSR